MSYPPPPQNPQGYPQPPGYQQPAGYPPPGYAPPGYGPPGYAPPGYPPGGNPPTGKGRKKFNSITALFVFYLPALWRDVGQRWWGIGFIYMFLLVALSWLPIFIQGQSRVANFVSTEAPKLTSQIPVFTITKGVVAIDRPEPYTITDPESGQPLVVIDTSGDTTEPPPHAPSFLVTKHAFVARKNALQTQTYDLSTIPAFRTDGNEVQQRLQWISRGWWPVAYPATVVVNFIERLVLMLIFALIGLGFASGMKAPVGFGGLLRLSAIAMTPVILIDTVTWFTPNIHLGGCFWGIGGGVLDLLMLFLAVKANAPKFPAVYSGPQDFPMAPQVWPQQGGYSGPYASGPPMPPPPPR